MSVLDSNGRLFGRVNVIDAAVIAIMVAAVPVAAVAYRSMRADAVQVSSLTPGTVKAETPARVTMAGAGFRAYLKAYVAPAGTPFVLTQADRLSQETKYLLSSAISAELELPGLAPGAYDLYIYDGGRQVAARPAALRVTAPQPQAMRQAKVRFYLPPETAPLLKAGDKDQPGGAVVSDVRHSDERSEVMEMHLVDQDNLWTGQRMTGQLVEITLDLPLTQTAPDTWVYGDQQVLAGNVFLMTTDRYRLHGVVTWVGDVQQRPAGQ